MTRVVHVSAYFAPAFGYGGPPASILGLCKGLLEAGVDVQVLTTTADGKGELGPEISALEEFEGVPVRYFSRGFPRRLFRAPALKNALREALSRADLAHLHGLWNMTVWTAARECRRAGVPFVVSPRGMLDPGSLKHHALRKDLCFWAWERRYLQRAALLHTTSILESESVARLLPGAEISCLPNGVARPERPARPCGLDRLGIDGEHPVVLFLGRLHRTKRLDLLVQAIDRVARDIPDVQLVLAGASDGVRFDELRAQAARPETLRWVGAVAVDLKWDLLSLSDVLVQCSDSESFGMSVLEAMAAGVPVVVTRTCPWQVVQSAGAGLWVEQTVEAIAEGVSRVLLDPTLARGMGESGRSLAHRRYRWTVIAREMAARYDQILENHP